MPLLPILLAGLLLAALSAAPAATASPGPAGDPIPDRYIVVYEDDVADPGEATARRERAHGFRSGARFRHAVKGFSARLSARQRERLEADPAVALVAPDRIVRKSSTPLAQGDLVPEGVRRIQAGSATTARGASASRVAVLDTGIDLAHPDLNAAHGRNCLVPGAPAQDDDGHGTHVAGTVAARNQGRGVVGVAPDTQVVAVKVLNADGEGRVSDVMCGLDWVASTREDGDPGNEIHVATLSLGSRASHLRTCATTGDPLHRAVCRATAAGVVQVAAAGNDARPFDEPGALETPAAYPEVLAVTAMSDLDGQPGGRAATTRCGADDHFAGFSNWASTGQGAHHTIAAPGACVRSTVVGGEARLSGTSMAAPHVAGLVALCLSERGVRGPCAGRTPAEIIQTVRSHAAQRLAGDPGYGFHGDPSRPVGGRVYGPLAWAPPPSEGSAPARVAAPAPQSSADPGTDRHPAKLQVARSSVLRSSRRLDVLAPITRRATGSASVTFHAAGRRVSYRPSIDSANGRIRFQRSISRAQANLGTGIVTIRYAGNASTRGQEVRLRAAAGRARLSTTRPTLSGGRLRARGTISSRARGVVRVQLDYVSAGRERVVETRARISNGRWSLDVALPRSLRDEIADRRGTVHSHILFTGYLPQRMRGEMRSLQVLGPR